MKKMVLLSKIQEIVFYFFFLSTIDFVLCWPRHGAFPDV